MWIIVLVSLSFFEQERAVALIMTPDSLLIKHIHRTLFTTSSSSPLTGAVRTQKNSATQRVSCGKPTTLGQSTVLSESFEEKSQLWEAHKFTVCQIRVDPHEGWSQWFERSQWPLFWPLDTFLSTVWSLVFDSRNPLRLLMCRQTHDPVCCHLFVLVSRNPQNLTQRDRKQSCRKWKDYGWFGILMAILMALLDPRASDYVFENQMLVRPKSWNRLCIMSPKSSGFSLMKNGAREDTGFVWGFRLTTAAVVLLIYCPFLSCGLGSVDGQIERTNKLMQNVRASNQDIMRRITSSVWRLVTSFWTIGPAGRIVMLIFEIRVISADESEMRLVPWAIEIITHWLHVYYFNEFSETRYNAAVQWLSSFIGLSGVVITLLFEIIRVLPRECTKMLSLNRLTRSTVPGNYLKHGAVKISRL